MEKQIVGPIKGREPWSQKKARGREKEREREKVHRRSYKENIFLKPLTEQTRGADFVKFYKQWISNTKVLEVLSLASVEPRGHCSAPVEKAVRL